MASGGLARATYGGLKYSNGYVPKMILGGLTGQPDATLRLDAAGAWNRARADVAARRRHEESHP